MRSDKRKFQFHYGTIKSKTAIEKVEKLKSFNSTMVRLKESENYQNNVYDNLFQFHYGTIKRESN